MMKWWFYCLLLLTLASIYVDAAKGIGRGGGRRKLGNINRFGIHNMPNLNRNPASVNYYENKDVS